MPANKKLIMSPLAAPVVAAVFENAESAGLAAKSLISAVFKEAGANIEIGEIIEVTPERWHGLPRERGARVDVEIKTADNERILVEVQMYADKDILFRNWFEAARITGETSVPGTTSAELARIMPKIFCVNVLNFEIRDDNPDLVQPVELMFTKEPVRGAFKNFVVYNVQLPKLDTMTPNFDSACYCWCYALYKAHKDKKTVDEVIDMTAELKKFKSEDSGFHQFCRMYNYAAGDPKTARIYEAAVLDQMWMESVMSTAKDTARAEGVAEGIAKRDIEFVQNLLQGGLSVDDIMKFTGLSREKVEEIERGQK